MVGLEGSLKITEPWNDWVGRELRGDHVLAPLLQAGLPSGTLSTGSGCCNVGNIKSMGSIKTIKQEL